jgi:enoyl-CoA hydratase/carnithine racemase
VISDWFCVARIRIYLGVKQMITQTHFPVESLAIRQDYEGTATITLNRPKNYNALSQALMSELQAHFDDLKLDQTILVVVIKGAGPGFSAGHDLKEMQVNRDEPFFRNFFEQCSKLMQSIIKLPQPVIAQIHGTAAAAGCQLVATCDLAIAADTAKFATPGVNIGLFCSTPMVAVSRKIPRKKMMEMLLLGDLITAKNALDFGLINQVVKFEELEETVLSYVKKIKDKSPLVLKIGKEAFYNQMEMPLDDAYKYTAEVMTQNMLAQDANEGINAFIEKRPPNWKGK